MKRKFASLLVFLCFILSATSCTNRAKLLFLNWGEYIDETLIDAFEKKENCTVVMDLADSNEKFYSKIRGGTTVYDVVCPSDYMVEKMYRNQMLSKLDMEKLPTYKSYRENQQVLQGVSFIASQMESNCSGISDYYVPYLWGTWGIMYSTHKEGLEQAIQTSENEWSVLFERTSLPSNTKVAMYESHQHAYYAACQYLGIDHTKELDSKELKRIHDLIKNMNFDAWGTDNIKKDIVAENLDVGFMWTGDFLYYYCENVANTVMNAYLKKDVSIDKFEEMIEVLTGDERIYTAGGTSYDVGFDIFIPKDTIAFCDNLVITKDAAHKDLAHKFIDFMCSSSMEINGEEVKPAYSNTYYVCYNTPYENIYGEIRALSDVAFTQEDERFFQEEIRQNNDAYDTTLYNKVYDYATGIAFGKYYPENEIKGNILHAFDRKYINQLNTTFNNARA